VLSFVRSIVTVNGVEKNGSGPILPQCMTVGGRLYLAYNRNTGAANKVGLFVSSDDGQNWTEVPNFPVTTTGTDLPRLAIGPSGTGVTGEQALWVSFYAPHARLCGIKVNSSGFTGTWRDEPLSNGTDCRKTGVAVGPSGEVMVVYTYVGSRVTTAYTAIDPDGFGATYSLIYPNNFQIQWGTGDEFPIALCSFVEYTSVPSLAFDTNHKAYLVYHARTTGSCTDYSCNAYCSDTDIFIRDAASTTSWNWSSERSLSGAVTKSQLFPRIAADTTRPLVAATWYDCRNDGSHKNAHTYAAVSRDGFSTMRTFQITPGTSSGTNSVTSELYDYVSMTFYRGWIYPVWQDNSNSTGDNTDGSKNKFDSYIARIPY
jgi:hypothetical protein